MLRYLVGHLRKFSESMGDRWRQSVHLGDPRYIF